GLWRDRRARVQVGLAAIAVAAATAPFLLPYIELRRLGFSPRSLDETRRFSADVYAYLTADPNLPLGGPVAQAWPYAEGVLFPGLTIVALAMFGVVCARSQRRADPLATLAVLVALAWAAVVVALLFDNSIRLPGIKITSLSRVLAVGAMAGT